MNTHNICFHGEIRKKYLGGQVSKLWPMDFWYIIFPKFHLVNETVG